MATCPYPTWLSLLLTIPTIVWGHMLAELTAYRPPNFLGSHWIAPLFGTLVFVYGGRATACPA